jgi:hypothetical protein
MLTLFDLKYQSQETPVQEEEEEITDESEWTKEIGDDWKTKKTSIVLGRELDVVKANLQYLEQPVKDSKIKEKKRAKKSMPTV